MNLTLKFNFDIRLLVVFWLTEAANTDTIKLSQHGLQSDAELGFVDVDSFSFFAPMFPGFCPLCSKTLPALARHDHGYGCHVHINIFSVCLEIIVLNVSHLR